LKDVAVLLKNLQKLNSLIKLQRLSNVFQGFLMGSANVFQASFRRLSGVFQCRPRRGSILAGPRVGDRTGPEKLARSVILSTGNGLVLEGLQNLVF
jgi:hypothetical protein